MTKFNLEMNKLNVTLVNGTPVRFIPIELVISDSGRSGDWHGWSYEIYRTKTGKLILGTVSWSSVQGESDYLHVIIGSDEKDLYGKLNLENHIHRLIGVELQKRVEITETI